MELLNEAITNNPAFCPNGCGHSYRGSVRRRKYNLKQHLIYVCGVKPQFKCAICQKRIRHRHSLRYHMATAHSYII